MSDLGYALTIRILKCPGFRMLPKVESSCAEFHQEASHLQSRKFLLPSLPHKDTEGAGENTGSVGVVGERCCRSASICYSSVFQLQPQSGKRVIEFVVVVGSS